MQFRSILGDAQARQATGRHSLNTQRPRPCTAKGIEGSIDGPGTPTPPSCKAALIAACESKMSHADIGALVGTSRQATRQFHQRREAREAAAGEDASA